MRRRTLIQYALSGIATAPFRRLRAWAQTAAFPGSFDQPLKELAATILPASLGRQGTDAIADQFVRWVRQYRPGAELQHGYGVTRIRFQGPSPAPHYLTQLEQLARGPLTQTDLVMRRDQLAATMKTANIKDLPPVPDGNSIVADIMSFFFNSDDANDLAYHMAIGRNKCRGLKDSGDIPPTLKGSRSDGTLRE
jgi:hypothetical protein